MPFELSQARYPEIRAALSPLLDDETLTDGTISFDIYAGRACAWVMQRDPGWASRTASEMAHLVSAAILRCASLIAPAMPNLTSEKFGDGYQYGAAPVDWAARSAQLAAAADMEIASVLTPITAMTPARPTLFAVASGRRGR